MNLFTQIVLVVGRSTPSGVQMLGTGFLVSCDGKIATAKHVINGDERNLVVLMPKINNINLYQDSSDTNLSTYSSIYSRNRFI
jgi:S1-C subfamily serine protease